MTNSLIYKTLSNQSIYPPTFGNKLIRIFRTDQYFKYKPCNCITGWNSTYILATFLYLYIAIEQFEDISKLYSLKPNEQ